jgi:hypothetical protein
MEPNKTFRNDIENIQRNSLVLLGLVQPKIIAPASVRAGVLRPTDQFLECATCGRRATDCRGHIATIPVEFRDIFQEMFRRRRSPPI